MKTQIFEYAIIWHPSKEQDKNGEKAKILVEPTVVLSESEQNVTILASRQIPEDYLSQLNQIDIAVRPF